MHPLPRWQRRSAALWVGIVAAFLAVLVVAELRYREHFRVIVIVSAVVAIAGGVLRTIRLRAQGSEPMITVEDLRKR